MGEQDLEALSHTTLVQLVRALQSQVRALEAERANPARWGATEEDGGELRAAAGQGLESAPGGATRGHRASEAWTALRPRGRQSPPDAAPCGRCRAAVPTGAVCGLWDGVAAGGRDRGGPPAGDRTATGAAGGHRGPAAAGALPALWPRHGRELSGRLRRQRRLW